MEIDRGRVSEKLGYIRDQRVALEELVHRYEKDAFLSEPWIVRGAKYALQTSIEAMIDAAYHISAKAFAHAPTDGRDALQTLADNDVFTSDELTRFSTMIGFRNRVVHGYLNVSAERVYEMLESELADFDQFIDRISAFVFSQDKE